MNVNLRVSRGTELIHGPGLGDNSLGVAALFGLLWSLRERAIQLTGDVWFVANVCEEGLGDLRGMKAVVDRFGEDVRAYLVLEGLGIGTRLSSRCGGQTLPHHRRGYLWWTLLVRLWPAVRCA